ncbi:MAG: heavy metal-binding domain-containing protein [Ferruginibacter sp.]
MKKNQKVILVHNVQYGSHGNMSSGNYTCSMHPEVKSDKPGKCPKCGMELVKQD